MRVELIPLNSDNYGYLLVDEEAGECAIVDVSNQPDAVLEAVKCKGGGAKLTAVLTTHKHWDHAGGNETISAAVPGITIFGGSAEGVEACNKTVTDGEQFMFGKNLKVTCLLTPGHTMGHISYYVEHGSQRVVFTGDALFVGGAGKFFEGTGADMYTSLFEKLGQLPDDTLVYCGHEYTLSNYRFALSIDPDNVRLQEENARSEALRAEGRPTVPSSIAQERATNPFMRIKEPAIMSRFPSVTDPADLLTAVRVAKDAFR